ncbi:RNA-dependent ATPase rok1 [Microbotryomycetes sp. JL221]|nr:RNA-dependent ATPase rok1 [Microbotryomycetes sp. JL221]
MDAFRTLTGGIRFDKRQINAETNVFGSTKAVTSNLATELDGSNVPAELDFFGSSAVNDADSKRSTTTSSNKRKRQHTTAERVDKVSAQDLSAVLKRHKIKLTGIDVPEPILSIDQVISQTNCNQVLSDNWTQAGFDQSTGVQMASWGIMLAKRDILVCAPTGSGKTLSFIVPLLAMYPPRSHSTSTTKSLKPKTIIIEPTRELSMQVLRETEKLSKQGGWRVNVLSEQNDGSIALKQQFKNKKKKKKVHKGKKSQQNDKIEAEQDVNDEEEITEPNEAPLVDMLISTPLRLIFAIKNGAVDVSDVEHLILDEADKLFELNFVEQTDEILTSCKHPNLRKGMFSATMPSSVEELAKSVMSGAGTGAIRAIVGHKDSATETIDQKLMFVGTEDHKLLSLRSIIQQDQFTPPVLIFVQSILRAKELTNELLFDGINVDCIHAERTVEERDKVVENFSKGNIWCLIATDVMGRGVDFKGVKLVINYDFPQSAGSYIHRIGRTGRAGKQGRAITFFTKADAAFLKTIVNVMRSSGCQVPEWMLQLKNPTKKEKKKLQLKPIARKDVSKTSGAGSELEVDSKRSKRKRIMGGGDDGKQKKKVKSDDKAQAPVKRSKADKQIAMDE